MRLMAYNFRAKYPNKDGGASKIIVLVSEYVPCGELFDILYYTRASYEIIARTYFCQLILGIEACQLNNMMHRDIKPQKFIISFKIH